jgi:hypothetical protein
MPDPALIARLSESAVTLLTTLIRLAEEAMEGPDVVDVTEHLAAIAAAKDLTSQLAAQLGMGDFDSTGRFDEFLPPPPKRALSYDSPPRDASDEPRHGDAFLVEGRRVPLTVDVVLPFLEDQPKGEGVVVRGSDGALWRLTRRPDTDDGMPFPLFAGTSADRPRS